MGFRVDQARVAAVRAGSRPLSLSISRDDARPALRHSAALMGWHSALSCRTERSLGCAWDLTVHASGRIVSVEARRHFRAMVRLARGGSRSRKPPVRHW